MMSDLTRWEPGAETMSLREAMNRLFDDAFMQPFRPGDISTLPTVDMYQTDNEVVVQTALPGFKEDKVKINVTGNILSLSGETKQDEEKKGATYHLHERRYGAFKRSLRLPTDVKADKAKADFEDGILTINLPIAEHVKPKTISIKPK